VTSFNADETRFQFRKVAYDLSTAKLSLQNCIAMAIDAVHPEHILSDIKTNRGGVHGASFRTVGTTVSPLSGKAGVHTISL
jgi:hypothetical protein